MTEDKALEFAKNNGLYFYTSALYVGEWKGFEVYSLHIESSSGEVTSVGLPQWVLFSANETRLAVGDECFELLDSFPTEDS